MKVLILTKIEYKNKIGQIFKKQKIKFDFRFCSENKKNYKFKKNLLLGKKINNKDLKFIKNQNYDYIFVILWPYLLQKKFYEIPKFFSINLHLGYLPFNRGKNSNIWPIIDGTPAGVSSHIINSGIDAGAIISQKKVNVDIFDTGKELYKKLINQLFFVLNDTIKMIKSKKMILKKNDIRKGSIYYKKDFKKKLVKIDLDKKIYPLDFINFLRSRNFSPYPLPYFKFKNKKVYVEINLKKE